ncbi:MAG: HD domain-containing protein [Firmicutes bacterium]|uniref:HD domain-containing protein n=1 Tax=Candidatus Stercoripulliclostridium pullicola TaxID=2840953 RepID=A0A940DH99_9FIRM|nr:HD domain-containing protein [Candidatus Stercoripulliclostridium pullicola]
MFCLYRYRDPEATETLIDKLCSTLTETQSERTAATAAVLRSAAAKANAWLKTEKNYPQNAKRNNLGQPVRSNGDAYVNHSIRTALILHESARTNTSRDVLVAALLLDAVIAGYPVTKVRADFGDVAAALVENVNFVTLTERNYIDSASGEEDVEAFLASRMPQFLQWALLIKFAARFDELTTADALDENSQREIVLNTEKFLLPLMKQSGALLFAEAVEEETFRIREKLRKKQSYPDFHEALDAKFKELNILPWIRNVLDRLNGVFIFDEFGVPYLEGTLFDSFMLLPNYMYRAYAKLEQSNISDTSDVMPSVFVNRIIAVTNLRQHAGNVAALALFDAIARQNRLKDLHVTGIGENVVYFRDEYLNEYEVRTVPKEALNDFLFGQIGNNSKAEAADSDVTVYDENGRPVILPTKATAIDYAFITDPVRAVRLTGVKINGAEASIFMPLENNGRVELIFDEKPQATLQWLYYCTVAEARVEMIEYFGRIIAGLRVALLNAYDDNGYDGDTQTLDAEPLWRLMFNYEPQTDALNARNTPSK